jgi:hypothetical protein
MSLPPQPISTTRALAELVVVKLSDYRYWMQICMSSGSLWWMQTRICCTWVQWMLDSTGCVRVGSSSRPCCILAIGHCLGSPHNFALQGAAQNKSRGLYPPHIGGVSIHTILTTVMILVCFTPCPIRCAAKHVHPV